MKLLCCFWTVSHLESVSTSGKRSFIERDQLVYYKTEIADVCESSFVSRTSRSRMIIIHKRVWFWVKGHGAEEVGHTCTSSLVIQCHVIVVNIVKIRADSALFGT